MFIMFTIAAIGTVLLAVSLLALVCRHRPDMWIAADDTILCYVAPGLIMLSTFGVLSLGWRITNGGFGGVPIGGWIGSAVIIGLLAFAWTVLAPRIRATRA